MMNNKSKKYGFVFLGMVFVFAVPVLFVAAQNNFTGKWKINRQMSDKLEDKIVRADVAATNEEGLLKSGEMVRQPFLGPFSTFTESFKTVYNEPEFRVEPEMKMQNQLIKALPGKNSAMPVGEDGNFIRLTAPFAPTHVFYIDGRIVKKELQSGKMIEIKAFRAESKIVVTEDLPFGEKAVQTFELSPDGKQLFLIFQVETSQNKEQSVPIRFVYDRVND